MRIRFKERGTPLADLPMVPGSITEYRKDSAGKVTQVTLSGHGLSGGSYESTVGEDVKNFHARKRSGSLLPQTHFNQFWEARSGSVSIDVSAPSNGWRWAGSLPWFVSSGRAFPPFESAREELVAGAAAKLYARGFDGLTFVAELRQVIRMFKNVWLTFVKLLRRYDIDEISSAYLQLRYGWRPLIYDLKAISELIRSLDSSSKVYKARVQSVQTVSDSFDVRYDIVDVNFRRTCQISERVSVYSKLAPPKVLASIPVTAWELVTLSFVVDWFVAVGTWLKQLEGLAYHTDLIAAYGVNEALSIEAGDCTIWLQDRIGTYDVSSVYTAVRTTRVPISIPIPPTPTFRVDLDFWKMADLAALLRGRLGR